MSGMTRNFRDAVVTLSDSGSNSLELVLDEGNLDFEETINPSFAVMDRGVLDHWRKADEVAVAVSFSAKLTKFLGDTVNGETLHDVLGRTGDAGDSPGNEWVSTCPTVAPDLHGVILEFAINNPLDASASEKVTFNKFVCNTFKVTEGDEYDIIAVTGIDLETSPSITSFNNS